MKNRNRLLVLSVLLGILYMLIVSYVAIIKRTGMAGGFPNDLLDWFSIVGGGIFLILSLMGIKNLMSYLKSESKLPE